MLKKKRDSRGDYADHGGHSHGTSGHTEGPVDEDVELTTMPPQATGGSVRGGLVSEFSF